MPNSPQPINRLLEWTGERCVPWVTDWQVLYEHLHRYHFVADLADGKRVLDLGSGEGYGSAILAERATSVLGVELDPLAVKHATVNYARANLEFRESSILELGDLTDASFDLVICYEVIEHITEHEDLLGLVRRVLTPDGVFVVSTPDREIYSEAANYHNPFHTKELNRAEFAELLSGFFAHHAMWSQSLAIGSALRHLGGTPHSGWFDEIFVRRDGDRWERHAAPPVPYLVAIASQAALPALPDFSLLNDPGLGALRAPAAPTPEANVEAPDEGADRNFELWDPERLRRQVAIFEDAVASLTRANQQAAAETRQLRHDRDVAIQQAASLQGRFDEIVASRAWRALAPYRKLRSVVARQAERSRA
jgi:O-antigen biosynthesis protein